MTIKQRAISQSEKQERREAILAAAEKLLVNDDYHDISMASVARKTGLAKGTIFLYFKTKEELFLQLQVKGYRSWFRHINKRLKRLSLQKQKINIQEFVDNIMASFKDNPVLIRLTPILHVILERNIDYKTALDFKRFLLNEIVTTGRLIEQCLLFLRKNDGARFLLYFQVLLIGLIQMSQPAPTVKQVIEEERMEVFQLDFEEKLSEMMILLINGMKATKRR
ncbi:MAG: TetR family transcriptional regulator [Deltaproteobacteria bacterium]|nr:TetR family transcriptional regulator [Deltaproteobacteria bacterium]